jgi:hypothetical protein
MILPTTTTEPRTIGVNGFRQESLRGHNKPNPLSFPMFGIRFGKKINFKGFAYFPSLLLHYQMNRLAGFDSTAALFLAQKSRNEVPNVCISWFSIDR